MKKYAAAILALIAGILMAYLGLGIDVIRVLHPIIQNCNEFTPELLQEQERYFVKFAVQAVYNKKLIKLIGNYRVPSAVKVQKNIECWIMFHIRIFGIGILLMPKQMD